MTTNRLEDYRFKLWNLFESAAIPFKDIVLTHTTIIIKMYGEKHTQKVAGILNASGYKQVRILDDRPTAFTTRPTGEYWVTARM